MGRFSGSIRQLSLIAMWQSAPWAVFQSRIRRLGLFSCQGSNTERVTLQFPAEFFNLINFAPVGALKARVGR